MARVRSDPGPCLVCGATQGACRGPEPDSAQVTELARHVQITRLIRSGVMTQGKGPMTYGETPDLSPPPEPLPPDDVSVPVEDTPEPEPMKKPEPELKPKKKRSLGIPGGAKKK